MKPIGRMSDRSLRTLVNHVNLKFGMKPKELTRKVDIGIVSGGFSFEENYFRWDVNKESYIEMTHNDVVFHSPLLKIKELCSGEPKYSTTWYMSFGGWYVKVGDFLEVMKKRIDWFEGEMFFYDL